MLEYEEYKVTERAVVKFTCDKCKKEITNDDFIESQETHSIRLMGGYGSVFGDGSEVSCDLCQHCLHNLIKDFCVYEDEEEYIGGGVYND
jgi:hypothetical protein